MTSFISQAIYNLQLLALFFFVRLRMNIILEMLYLLLVFYIIFTLTKVAATLMQGMLTVLRHFSCTIKLHTEMETNVIGLINDPLRQTHSPLIIIII